MKFLIIQLLISEFLSLLLDYDGYPQELPSYYWAKPNEMAITLTHDITSFLLQPSL